MIQGTGFSSPSVMLVGDFGQGEDLTSNYALSGYKERVLQSFATNAGVNYNSFYRTLLIKDPIPSSFNFDSEEVTDRKGNVKRKKKSKKHDKKTDVEQAKIYGTKLVPHYSKYLLDEIKTLQPNLIVPLGETSFQFLTGLEGIRKFRGSILPLSPLHGVEKYTKILPILGPYPYLNKEYRQKFISQLDFNKIPKWSDERPIPDDTYRIWIAKTYSAFRAFVDRAYPICEAKTIEEGGYLVFDIESYLNIPTCLSFCFDGFESCCIPILDNTIDIHQRCLMLDLVAKVLDSSIPKVNQNIKYDWKTEERWAVRITNIVGDTMLAASTLYCEFPKNLGFLTSLYTDIPYFKDEGRQFDPSKHKREQFYLYNAKDSLATHQIYSQQILEVKEQGVEGVYKNLVKLMPIYRRMEDRGIRIDEQRRDKLIAKYESLFRIHLATIRRLINRDDFNPLSSQQAATLIFVEMEFHKIMGVKGTDEESVNMLLCSIEKNAPKAVTSELGCAVLRELIWCRKIHKVLETLRLDLYPDGRFRCEANLAGTETGRTTNSQTTDYYLKELIEGKKQKIKKLNLGHSLQTIGKHGFFIEDTLYGKDVRGMFVPSFGYRLVEIDLSGAEARVDRVLSANFDLSVFDNPGIHKLTGSWLFDKQPSEIKKGTHEYHLAKTFRHAGERNMGAKRAFMMCQDEGVGISLTLRECDNLLKKFHANAPEIQRVYHHDIERAIKETCILICPNGRRRDFFDRIDHHTINEGISFPPQAIVSDQTKFSFIKTFEEAPWAHLLSEAHDGSLAEVPCGRELEYARIYEKNIVTPIDFRYGSLKRDYNLLIPAETSMGENWEEMKDVKL